MARRTGLEPATPGVTGRYSNQLSYNRAVRGCLRNVGGGVNRPKAKIIRPETNSSDPGHSRLFVKGFFGLDARVRPQLAA